jgi:hypothetical protein
MKHSYFFFFAKERERKKGGKDGKGTAFFWRGEWRKDSANYFQEGRRAGRGEGGGAIGMKMVPF